MSKILSRDDILGADDLKTELVEVGEWGGAIYVRGMTAAERDALEGMVSEGSRDERYRNLTATMAQWCMVDEAGNQLFTAADIEALSKKSSAAILRVTSAARRLSRLTSADIEELLGNSDAVHSDDSASL